MVHFFGRRAAGTGYVLAGRLLPAHRPGKLLRRGPFPRLWLALAGGAPAERIYAACQRAKRSRPALPPGDGLRIGPIYESDGYATRYRALPARNRPDERFAPA